MFRRGSGFGAGFAGGFCRRFFAGLCGFLAGCCAFLFIYRFDGVGMGRCRPGLLGSMSHGRKGQCSKK